MKPYFDGGDVQLYLGDCREVLAAMPDGSIDAVVTDPPYELAFMGRSWDSSGIAFDPALWAEVLRVLKPGGHLLAFGGTRTYHRLAVAIEDAGFEIRDSIHWIFGSGFPKGQAIDKAIDRQRNDRTEILKVTAFLSAARDAAGWGTKQIDELFGFNGMASHWTAIASKAASVPTPEQWDRLRDALGFDDIEIRPLVAELNGRKGTIGDNWARRELVGEGNRVRRDSDVQFAPLSDGAYPITAPASDAAQLWQGWNTSLKPAHEPIVLARKSTGFNTTVANVLEHGTGALNINGCRIAHQEPPGRPSHGLHGKRAGIMGETVERFRESTAANTAGRWPTNVVFTHLPECGPDDTTACVEGCAVAELDRQSGLRRAGGDISALEPSAKHKDTYSTINGRTAYQKHHDEGGASRFFPVFRYEAKAPASERPRLADGTAHTTVKPVALMRWLVRLVTQPGGLVLDPFAGSGTTGEACVIEGFRAVLIEMEELHAQLILARLSKPIEPTLFGEVT